MKMKLLPGFLALLVSAAGLAAEPDHNSLPVKAVLFPIREAVLSTLIDGMISQYHFHAGERFKKGDVLFNIDDRRSRNEFSRAESQVREAELSLTFAKQRLDDNERLYKSDLSSELEVQKSRFDYGVAQERLQTARINRADAQLHLQFCVIKAPFDGTVEKLLIREYEMVRSGQPVLSVIDDNQLLAVMNLPTTELAKIRIGLPVTIRITENGKTVTGDVYEIASRADHRSETFEIRVRIDNSSHLFKAGMSGVLVKTGE